MWQPVSSRGWAQRGAAWLLLAAIVAAPAAALGQDPINELKEVLQAQPNFDPALSDEKRQQEETKFFEVREHKVAQIVQTRLRSPGALRQALILLDKDRTRREDIRFKAAQLFRDRVRAIVAHGDEDSKAAIANLITEMGPTVRAAIDPGQAAPANVLDAERRGGFARTLTPEMERLANDDSEFVRLHALRALSGINADPKVVAPIFAKKLTGNQGVRVRRAAADGLFRLITVANYVKDAQRLKALPVWTNKLDVLNTEVAVVQQAPAGLADPDSVVRTRCADALRYSAQVLAQLFESPPGEKKNLPALDPFSGAEIAAVKDTLKAFQDAGPRLTPILQDPDPEVRLALAQGLERLSDIRFRLAEDSLTAGTADNPIRVRLVPPHAADPLANFARGDWRSVARLLADPDARVRRAAVNFFEFFAEARPEVVTDMSRALCDPDRFVRWGATRSLGNFLRTYQPKDAVPAVPALAKVLFDPDMTIRLAAAATLESLGEYAVAAVPELARAVHFGDTENRVAALYVLQSIGPERATAAIGSVTEAMVNRDARVRRTAAETLGRFGPLARSKMTIDALRRALGDDDPEVRINASEAMLQVLDAGNTTKP